jgi:alkylation response protein AidB-like acyl-CoA dehydrogenase
MLSGADVGFAMLLGGSRAGATLLAAHADVAIKEACLPKLASGEWSATIAVTEAGAGTDVGQIQTRAKPLGDGRYALSGTKIFISNGDHDLTDQILHITLARIEGAPAGTRGLSLFLAPMWRFDTKAANGVWVSALEEKMGLHGSPTCVLNFDRAEATLIGAEGGGLAALFTMMNEMRLDVGLIAVGLMAGATRHAADYARERRQGRGPGGESVAIIEHPDVRRMLSIMTAQTEGGRALALETARLMDLADHGSGEAAARAARIAAFLTPVCKAGLSERATEVTSIGVQVFGGHGYVKETGAEQFMRDARVLALYEGANGVQAIDLAVRKLQRDGGAAFADLSASVCEDLTRLEGAAEVAAIYDATRGALAELTEAAKALLAAEPGGEAALAAAWPFLELATHTCLVWMMLRMAGADAPVGDPVLARKRALAEFYAAYYGGQAAALASRLRAIMAAPNLYETVK